MISKTLSRKFEDSFGIYYAKFYQMPKDKYNWRIMEINDMDSNLYHNYQYCPPWALSSF